MRINDKKSVCIHFRNKHDVCCAERYDGSIHADRPIWVFIFSVLGRSNVLSSPPDPNFTNLLMQYLAKLGECIRECHHAVNIFQISPSAFICH